MVVRTRLISLIRMGAPVVFLLLAPCAGAQTAPEQDQSLVENTPTRTEILYIAIDREGIVGTSDPAWVRSVPGLRLELDQLAAELVHKLEDTDEVLTILISPHGVYRTSNQSILQDGQSIEQLLYRDLPPVP